MPPLVALYASNYNGLSAPVTSPVLTTSAVTIDHYFIPRSALIHVTMVRKFLECFALIVLFQFVTQVHLQNLDRRELGGNNHLACAYVQCEKTESCVHRKFRCKNPPCPGMLYCAKSRTESLRGPSTCDTVHCSNGYLCMVKVRECLWDQKCKQQIARCVSQQEYHEGPASCAGFKCPQGHQCILRESLCANPPCKLLRSCSKNRDVHTWFSKCRSLGCPSEFDCFLRKPESTCSDPPCKHTLDCITATEDEVKNEHCRAWVCPRMHKCVAKTVTPCDSNNCDVNRTCTMVPQNNSSFRTGSLNNQDSHTQASQEDIKQFQDWFQSVKGILNPTVYDNWIEDILASTPRSEEFRKWLRTSQSGGSLKEEPSQDDLNKILGDIDGLLREWNLTNAKELFGKKRLFVPGYNGSEADLFYDLVEEKEILSYQSAENKSTNGQHPRILPVENMKITDTQMNNSDADVQHYVQKQIVITSQNEDIRDVQMNDFSFNVPETLKYLSSDNYELPSLWTGLDQNFEIGASEAADAVIDSYGEISETEQYRNNVSADVLEMLIKSLVHFSNETVQGNVDETSVDQSYPKNGNKNYTFSAVPYLDKDRFTSKNLEEVEDQSSLYGEARINFTYNSEPEDDGNFFSKLNIVRSSNHTDESYGSDVGKSSIQSMDASNEAVDLDRFFEMDKEALLSYIETLIAEIDLENDYSNETKQNMNAENLEMAVRNL